MINCFKFKYFFLLQLLLTIKLSHQIQIGEFTITNISDLYNNKGGLFYPPYSATNEYFQLCTFKDQIGTGAWDFPPQVNITQECYDKILDKNLGALDILIYKFFRIRNTTELEPNNLQAGISKIYEVYYQFIYFKNGDIEELTQIDIESICGENIIVSYMPTLSSSLKTNYLTVSRQNPISDPDFDDLKKYDIFNPNSDFYNSICSIYTYNTFVESFIKKESALKYYDLSLETRKISYFPGNVELCPVTCDYIGVTKYDEKLLFACQCDDQHFDLLGGTVPQYQTFSSIYYDENKFNTSNNDNYFSIDVISCFKFTLMFAFKNNYGSYIVLGIGILIVFAYGAIFLWGKGRILSIFELLYNNNINSFNYMNDKSDNNYDKLYENSQNFSNIKGNNDKYYNSRNNQKDLALSMSSKRGLNYGNQFINNNLINNQVMNNNKNMRDNNIRKKSKNQYENETQRESNPENREDRNDKENEEYEEIDEEMEEEEDDELYPNPPKKIKVKKSKKNLGSEMNNNIQIYNISSHNNINNYEESNEESLYGNNQNEDQNQYYEEEYNNPQENKKNLMKKNYIKNNKRLIEDPKIKNYIKAQKKQEKPIKLKPKQKKKNENIRKKETIEENNYIPDIDKSQIIVPIDNIFTDQELNSMDLEGIYHYDKRSFIDVYFSILNIKAPMFFIFSYYNSNKGISLSLQIKYPAIKLIFFCIIIYICFFFNATVFGTKSMTYRLLDTYGFGKHIAYAVVLAPFCLIIKSIIYFLTFFEITKKITDIKIKCFTSILMIKGEETRENNFNSLFEDVESEEEVVKNNKDRENAFNEEEINKKDIKEERIKLKNQILDLFDFIKIRLFISIACMIIIILFIWYYITAFCVCYRNTQVSFLLNILLTFIFCNIIPCFYCFLPAFIRKLAIDKQDNKLYIFYRILQII